MHGAICLQGDEGKGKKNKKKGGSDSKTKKKTKVSTSKAADAKRKSYSDATVRKNVTTSPQHGNKGNNDPSTPGKTKPQTRKVLQPVILKTPTGKIQKGNYQVLHKRQVNKTALKECVTKTTQTSKYQKAKKKIMEKSSILQELDDLRKLDVEVRPLPPSPLPNMEDMELVENDTMAEDLYMEYGIRSSWLALSLKLSNVAPGS